jgi:hypothetical protein
MDATTPHNEKQILIPSRYVDAPRLLELLFDEASRPSLRWLRDRQKQRAIPFVRCGRRIFFDPQLVKFHLDTKAAGRKGAVPA